MFLNRDICKMHEIIIKVINVLRIFNGTKATESLCMAICNQWFPWCHKNVSELKENYSRLHYKLNTNQTFWNQWAMGYQCIGRQHTSLCSLRRTIVSHCCCPATISLFDGDCWWWRFQFPWLCLSVSWSIHCLALFEILTLSEGTFGKQVIIPWKCICNR